VRKAFPPEREETHVYKKSKCKGQQFIIELRKLPDTKTNENRNYVYCRAFAKYRASVLQCVQIYNIDLNQFQDELCTKAFWKSMPVRYKVGENVAPSIAYDERKNRVCSTGIHYFKSLLAAYMYQVNRSQFFNHCDVWLKFDVSGDGSLDIFKVKKDTCCHVLDIECGEEEMLFSHFGYNIAEEENGEEGVIAVPILFSSSSEETVI
jgi:hypothetical protein